MYEYEYEDEEGYNYEEDDFDYEGYSYEDYDYEGYDYGDGEYCYDYSFGNVEFYFEDLLAYKDK